MVTIAIVNATWGEKYLQFIPRFWQGIKSLQRQPDEIVLVVGPETDTAMRDAIPSNYSSITKVILVDHLEFNEYWDLAFRSASSDWLAGCCIDDWFLPEAFNELENADLSNCELVTDSIVLHPSNRVFQGVWDTKKILTQLVMPGFAPMKRTLYERLGGYDKDVYFSDWGLYIKAAIAGVSVYHTEIQRIMYDEGLTHQTMSGPLKDPSIDGLAHGQIRDLVQRLQK